MRKTTGQNIVLSTLLMLILPLFTLVYSLKSRRGKTFKKWMLTIFATIYASTFNIETIGDGSRHWARVYDYYIDLSFSQWLSDLGDIITFTTNHDVNEDVYIHVLSYFTGTILSAPGLFFVFVGFIYGYFFSASMVKLFDKFPSWKKHTGFFILACYFIAILNLQSMNTVRTWTGFWVMFYGVMQYHDTKKLKYLFMVLSAPLFHVGYFAMAIPVWIGLFFPIKRIWVIGIYILSFTTSLINSQAAISNLENTEVGQEKVSGYYVEGKATIADRFDAESKSRWYRAYKRSGILSWALVGLTVLFLLSGDYLRHMSSLDGTLFSIGLLSKVLSNSTWFLFALSNRSGVIANLFILAAILVYWQHRYFMNPMKPIQFPLRLKALWLVSIILILPYFLYFLSNTLEYLSVFILGFPMATWFDESLRITLRMALGWLLGIG